MKKTITTILVTFFLIVSLGTAKAVELPSGLTVGVSAGEIGAYGSGKLVEANALNGTTDVTTEEDGAFSHDYASIFAEFAVGPISVGVSYVPTSIESPQNVNEQNNESNTKGENTAKIEINDLTTVYVLAPLLGPLYAKVGYSMGDIVTKESLASGDTFPDTDTQGYTVGLGLQKEINDGFSFRVEVMAAAYDDVNSTSSDGNKTVDVVDLMSANATLSVMKTF